MNKLIKHNKENNNKIKHHILGRTIKEGTCFASFEKICTDSLTPDIMKANKLRHQKFW